MPRSRFPRRPGRLCGGRGPAARQQEGPGRAGPGLRSAPGAAGGAAGRQVNTPLGLRSVRGLEGQRGSPGPAGQPSPAGAGGCEEPGAAVVCVCDTNIPVVKCPSGKTRSRVHGKGLCLRFPHPEPLTTSAGIGAAPHR